MWYALTVSACVLDTLLIRVHVTLSRSVCECVCADAAKVVAGANKRAFSSLVPGPHRITRHDCRARHVASDLSPVLTARSPQHTATPLAFSLAGIWNRTVSLNLNARVFWAIPS
jgi:hypothetical protein